MATYQLSEEGDQAVVNLPLPQIREHLLAHKQWAGEVLSRAGHGGARVAYAKMYGALSGSTLVADGPEFAEIRGTAGKSTRLLFRLERMDETATRLIPAGAVEGPAKFFIPLALLCFCIVPVVLTPFAYKMRANAIKRISAKYLDAMCNYLIENVSPSLARP